MSQKKSIRSCWSGDNYMCQSLELHLSHITPGLFHYSMEFPEFHVASQCPIPIYCLCAPLYLFERHTRKTLRDYEGNSFI